MPLKQMENTMSLAEKTDAQSPERHVADSTT